MNFTQLNIKRTTFFVLVLLLAVLGSANAQYSLRWMNVGSMHSPYSEGLAAPEGLPYDNAPVQFPAVDFRSGHSRAQGFWIALKNFTDEKGRALSYKVIQTGPRPQSDLHFSPLETKVVSRWDPQVSVDGINSFKDFVTVDEIDPTLVPDRQIRMNVNSRVGVNTQLVVSAFSNEYHDSYHILEYRFTNTGNIDTDDEVELNNSLEGVYFFYISRYSQQEASAWVGSGGNVWGKFTMNDAIHDGMEDFPVDFRAQYAWGGWDAGQTAFNNMGGPLPMEHWIGDVDTTGRLGSATFVGRVYLHADKSTSDHSDDPGQPSTMGVWGSDSPDLPADEFNEELSRLKYENHIATGRLMPHHADDIEPSGDFAHPTNPPNIFREEYDEGGYAMIEGFGPYDMGIGEYIDVHLAEGAAGLSVDAATKIGQAYKTSGFDDDATFDYGGNSMTKNEWVMTAKDSIIQMFQRARAAYAADKNVPRPPAPPKTFSVHSLPNSIDLQWETYEGENPQGWEVHRAKTRFNNPSEYELLATLPGDARQYSDESAERGIDYYYYLQAVGPVNTDGTAMTPTGTPLKSGRYYTQTYIAANLKRAPGASMDDIRVVPNPFSLGQSGELRYPDKQDKLGFLDIPGQCTIKIYTQLGELVDTIEHTDGTGDEFWDHTTSFKQVVASGVYIAVIEDMDNGNKVFKKFVIVR